VRWDDFRHLKEKGKLVKYGRDESKMKSTFADRYVGQQVE
jgi:hypothetical protein